jgi:probable blue pigment (indigoidine) exporter
MKWNGISYLLVATVVWGINWSLVKFLLSEVPPLSGRAIAGVIGAAVTIGFAAVPGETLIRRVGPGNFTPSPSQNRT